MTAVQTEEELELDRLRGRLKHSDRLPALPKKGKRLEWRFDAYRDLLQRLGHGDGMAEVIEVARRDRASRDRRDKEAPLDWALDVLPGGSTRNVRRIWQERYEVLEYYRIVRNAFTHKVKQGTLDAALGRASAWSPIIKADLGLSAPNPFDRLTFDDFLLYTRMIKYVATDLCRIARPTRAEIAAHAERELSGPGKFRHWNWGTVRRERALASIAGHYERRHLFDFGSEPKLLDEIVDGQFSKFER